MRSRKRVSVNTAHAHRGRGRMRRWARAAVDDAWLPSPYLRLQRIAMAKDEAKP